MKWERHPHAGGQRGERDALRDGAASGDAGRRVRGDVRVYPGHSSGVFAAEGQAQQWGRQSLLGRLTGGCAALRDGLRERHAGSALLRCATQTAAAVTLLALGFVVSYILIRGVPSLRLEQFSLRYTSQNQSMFPAIVNTLLMTALSLLLAVPTGIGAAVYLAEYARKGSKLVKLARVTTETLSGIPSIVYGLFGMLLFNQALKLGYSMLSGALTMAMMILPLVLRTTEEALLSVPDMYREGSFGLGAGKLRTVTRIVLPSAVPGILSGVILAIGRVVGETAALMYTSGTVAKIAGLRDSGVTLALHMYKQASEGLYLEAAYATSVVLLALALAINLLSRRVASLAERKRG